MQREERIVFFDSPRDMRATEEKEQRRKRSEGRRVFWGYDGDLRRKERREKRGTEGPCEGRREHGT